MDPYFRYEPVTPQENDDYTRGRRDAWEAHKLLDATLDQLEDRWEWFVDPRISDFSAAYCGGYASQIQDFHAAETVPQFVREDAGGAR
ncbi:hypothetical protein [Streptomyces nigrescens]|uniref:hypothetical protein n=1 Tax=Streptomyces nigrescens TaxID=1920 RepID=UPI0036FCA422